MTDGETTIIPLDDAHEILSVFGVDPYSAACERWRRDDGFRLVDFEDVLNETSAVLALDWREELDYAVEIMIEQLAEIGSTANSELDDNIPQGTIRVGGQAARIKYVPNDNDDFDDVIESVNRIIGGTARYRKFRSCEGTDGWFYALLKNEDWDALDMSVRDTMAILFTENART